MKSFGQQLFPQILYSDDTYLQSLCPISTPSIIRSKQDLLHVLGNSFPLSEYAWKMSKKASPFCNCGASEETAVLYFLICNVYNEFRPQKLIN